VKNFLLEAMHRDARKSTTRQDNVRLAYSNEYCSRARHRTVKFRSSLEVIGLLRQVYNPSESECYVSSNVKFYSQFYVQCCSKICEIEHSSTSALLCVMQ